MNPGKQLTAAGIGGFDKHVVADLSAAPARRAAG